VATVEEVSLLSRFLLFVEEVSLLSRFLLFVEEVSLLSRFLLFRLFFQPFHLSGIALPQFACKLGKSG